MHIQMARQSLPHGLDSISLKAGAGSTSLVRSDGDGLLIRILWACFLGLTTPAEAWAPGAIATRTILPESPMARGSRLLITFGGSSCKAEESKSWRSAFRGCIQGRQTKTAALRRRPLQVRLTSLAGS